jgi:F0F1-type ATP synthase assembly protein I
MDENNPKTPPVATLNQSLIQGGKIGLQIGCAGVVLTIGALLLGLWLDGQLHTKPWVTIVLLIVSMPISVYVVFRLAQRAAYSAQRRERHSGEDKPSL